MIKMIIQGDPTTKKNSQHIIYSHGRPLILPSEKYRLYEDMAGYYLSHKGEKLTGPFNIRCLFYRATLRRCDLTNLLEAVDDVLVKYEVIADDNFKVIAGHDGSRVLLDRRNPRTEIYIEELDDEQWV